MPTSVQDESAAVDVAGQRNEALRRQLDEAERREEAFYEQHRVEVESVGVFLL